MTGGVPLIFSYLYPHNDTAKYEAVLDRFIEEIEYGPLYYALQDAELQNAQRVQIQGAMQRQQTAIRSSQRISQTLSETSDIINQGNWERSQRMDRIWEKTPKRSAASIPIPILPAVNTKRM